MYFAGIYLHGSAGKDDARFIRWKLQQFYEVYRVDGLVIDCRRLKYDWGDDIGFPTPNPLKTFPMLLVVEKEQSSSYAYALEKELHRHDLTKALSEMDERIRAMKSLL